MSVGVLPAPVTVHHLSAVPTEATASGGLWLLRVGADVGAGIKPGSPGGAAGALNLCAASPARLKVYFLVFVFKSWLAWDALCRSVWL